MELLMDALMDTLRLIPFLFLTYLAMEYLEDKAGEATIELLKNAGIKGPILGGLFGVIPQCGFSAAAAGFYSGGVISAGALVAVFLSTSDEMLPILISGKMPMSFILKVMIAKALIGITAGLLVDGFLHMRNHFHSIHIEELCEQDHCHCEEGSILLSAAIHTLQIALWIFGISLAVGAAIELVGMEQLVAGISRYPVISVLVSGLVGLIPNCAASVTLTTLFVQGVLPLGSMFAGLLACGGVGFVVLFRSNRKPLKNLSILGITYLISVVIGLLL